MVLLLHKLLKSWSKRLHKYSLKKLEALVPSIPWMQFVNKVLHEANVNEREMTENDEVTVLTRSISENGMKFKRSVTPSKTY